MTSTSNGSSSSRRGRPTEDKANTRSTTGLLNVLRSDRLDLNSASSAVNRSFGASCRRRTQWSSTQILSRRHAPQPARTCTSFRRIDMQCRWFGGSLGKASRPSATSQPNTQKANAQGAKKPEAWDPGLDRGSAVGGVWSLDPGRDASLHRRVLPPGADHFGITLSDSEATLIARAA